MSEKKKPAGRVWADGDGDEFHALAVHKVPPTRSAAIVVTSGLGVYLTAAQCREVAAHLTELADYHEEAARQSAPALPTNKGAVIVPADGREYIETSLGLCHYVMIHAGDGRWRGGAGVIASEDITPGTWKLEGQ